jgi:hypothetical protein
MFVARHVFATYAIGILACVAVAALLLAYVAHEAAWTTSTWAAIGILIVTQQAIALARTWVRVAQIASERHYFLRVSPAPVAVAPVPAAVPAAEPPAPTPDAAGTPPAPAETGQEGTSGV